MDIMHSEWKVRIDNWIAVLKQELYMPIAYPVVGTAINIFSVIFQIRAIRNNESKVKNIIMMIVTILLEAVVILFFVRFWQGAMSV